LQDLKGKTLCNVCIAFPEAVGHCRQRPEYVPPLEFVKRFVMKCDVYERKFYHSQDMLCPHERQANNEAQKTHVDGSQQEVVHADCRS